MDVDAIGVAGLIASITLVAVFGIIITQNGFPSFEQATLNGRLKATTQPIGQQVSSFMWTYRSIDIITQAFVLFVAAAGCLAILRVEEERKREAK
jgi:multisubunit Na+/H+ antiporter MnhB subunit